MTRLEMLADAITEEIVEVETINELKALWCFGQAENNEYADAMCTPLFKSAVSKFKTTPPVKTVTIEKENNMEIQDMQSTLAALMAEIEILKSGKTAPKEKTEKMNTAKYRILKFDVKWSTAAQVHTIMNILAAHAKVGDVLDEADIIRMMVENESALDTIQGGKRIWNYYKGKHSRGLMEHGNIEKV